VYETITRLMLSVELIDPLLLRKSAREVANSPLRTFHATLAHLCGRNFLVAQAVFDECIFAHGRPPRLLPLRAVRALDKETQTARVFELMTAATPQLAESLGEGIEAYMQRAGGKIARARSRSPARVTPGAAAAGGITQLDEMRALVGNMDALLLVAADWGVTREGWRRGVAEARASLTNFAPALKASAPAFVPARKRPYRAMSTMAFTSPRRLPSPPEALLQPSRSAALRQSAITPDTPAAAVPSLAN
jgi:hypothetical protein